MDDAARRPLPDDEASVASRDATVRLLRVGTPFRFAGRLGRGGYIATLIAWHVAFAIGAGVTITVVLFLASLVGGEGAMTAAFVAVAAVLFAVYVAGLVGFAVRRLHDLDRGGAWAVLGFVPLVGVVFGAYLLFAPGSDVANAYGDAPPRAVVVPVGAPTAAAEARLEAAFDAGRRFAERRGRGG